MVSKISPAKSAVCGNPVLLKISTGENGPSHSLSPEQEGLGCYG